MRVRGNELEDQGWFDFGGNHNRIFKRQLIILGLNTGIQDGNYSFKKINYNNQPNRLQTL